MIPCRLDDFIHGSCFGGDLCFHKQHFFTKSYSYSSLIFTTTVTYLQYGYWRFNAKVIRKTFQNNLSVWAWYSKSSLSDLGGYVMDLAFDQLDTKFFLPEQQPMATRNGAFSDVFKRNPRTCQRYGKSFAVKPCEVWYRFGHEIKLAQFRFTKSFNLKAHPKQHYHYHPQIIFCKTISWCQCTLVVRSYKAIPMMNRQRVFLQ